VREDFTYRDLRLVAVLAAERAWRDEVTRDLPPGEEVRFM